MPRYLLHFVILCLIGLQCTQGHGGAKQGNRTRRHVGAKRDFASVGGATAYIQKISIDRPDQLERVMRRSGVEDIALPAFAQMLEEDPDLDLDLENEVLFFECSGIITDELLPQEYEPDPLSAQAFQLSSRPSATRKIWLDFKGATITGTSWNTRSNNIVQPPYDKDNNPASFAAAELNDIVAIWRAVAEDYAIFDVDVTTIKPASLQGNMWVSIGGNASWYGSTPGGVANVGVFGDPYYQPAFVFPRNLGPNYAKYIWEAASHEIGHTLGLLHDGVTGGTTYYSGQGDWAPIMGSGYYKALTTWDKGEYTNSNQQQDDVAVISSYLPLLQQPAGNAIASATPLSVATADGATIGTANGLVVQPGVANYYSFQAAAAGAALIEVNVMLPWASNNWARSNLDAQLVVYASNGNIIASINPAGVSSSNGLGISPVTVQLPAAGKYYVAVSGASAGDPKASGYSNYCTRGSFKLMVKFPVSGGGSSPPSSPVVQPPVVQNPNPPATQQRPVYVSEIRISKSCSSTACTCNARVFLKDDSTSKRITAAATVTGTWTATPKPSSWKPYPYVISGVTSNGVVDLTAPRLAASGSCSFRVTGVKAAGYVFSSKSVKRGQISLESPSQMRKFKP